MQFIYDIPIPALTTEDDPETVLCKVSAGVVKKVMVGFPPGPRGLAHIRILYQNHQVWPTNQDGDFAWDNFVYEFDAEFRVEGVPYAFKVIAWNEDDTYSHTPIVGFNVLRGEYGLDQLLQMRYPAIITEG